MRIQPWAQAGPRNGRSKRKRPSTATGRRFMSIGSSYVWVRELFVFASGAPGARAGGRPFRREGSGLGLRRLHATLPGTRRGRAGAALINRMGFGTAHHKSYAHTSPAAVIVNMAEGRRAWAMGSVSAGDEAGSLLEGLPNDARQGVDVVRFLHVRQRSLAEQLGRRALRGVAARDQHAHSGVDLLQAPEALATAHHGHREVEQDEIDRPGVVGEDPEGLFATPCTIDKPRPAPWPNSLVVKNGSKMRDLILGSMPRPVSRTVRVTKCPGLASRFACVSPGVRARLPVAIVRRPPPGIASRALAHRCRRICSAWAASTAAVHRPGSHSTATATPGGSVGRSCSITRAAVSFRFTGALRVAALRLKVRSCAVSSAARIADFSISSIFLRFGSSAAMRILTRRAYPRIPVRRLLKSCAMPPASVPTLSIFCAWRSWSSSVRRSVVSRKIHSVTVRFSSEIGPPRTSARKRSPFLRTHGRSW